MSVCVCVRVHATLIELTWLSVPRSGSVVDLTCHPAVDTFHPEEDGIDIPCGLLLSCQCVSVRR